MRLFASGLNAVQRDVESQAIGQVKGKPIVVLPPFSRHPENGKSKDSNRRSIQGISWVQTATKLATSQEKQLLLCPLTPALSPAFLLSLCFLRSCPF